MRRRALGLSGIVIVLVLGILTSGWILEFVQAASENLFKELELFNRVLGLVRDNYVEEVVPSELIKGAIKGMLQTLDPYTIYMTRDEYNELMIDTSGQFGGLGIEISIREGILTVISPMEGTPAYNLGIQAGDKIIRIEGKSTEGITVQQAIKKLRGPKGTQVTITILREGVDEPFDVTITRDIIQIKSIPYSGMITPHIGYIRLANFSQGIGTTLEEKLIELEKNDLRGLILDLRSNPGGLLSQAVEVAEKFVDTDSLIVFTKGRIPDSCKEFRASDCVKHCDYPLIILIDNGSASASEIVAGAVQDWDKGLIVGNTTYGKGSVQNLIMLKDGSALKITTSKYYTPCGRCLHRAELMRKQQVEFLKPEETEEDTASIQLFFTSKKRPVHGGGGITPDVKIEVEPVSKLTAKISSQGLFFKFAVKYTAKHRDLQPDFKVTDSMVNEFKNFLKAEKIEYFSEEFDNSIDDIKFLLKLQICRNLWGTKGEYEFRIKEDVHITKAVELLSKAETTDELLKLATQY